jgi:hypothetical protein
MLESRKAQRTRLPHAATSIGIESDRTTIVITLQQKNDPAVLGSLIPKLKPEKFS